MNRVTVGSSSAIVIRSYWAATPPRDLRALVPKGSHRLHLRRDRRSLVHAHLAVLAQAHERGVAAYSAVARIQSARHEGRARVRCLAALVGHLNGLGVDELVIESRQRHRDVEDDRTLLRARQDGLLSPSVLWRHDRPYEEPLLWPPDAVAGSLGAKLTGADRTLLARLPDEFVETVWDGGRL